MAWYSGLLRRTSAPAPQPVRATFSSFHPLDYLIRGLEQYDGKPVSRAEALSVPAMARGRNLICSIATLPLIVTDDANNVIPTPFLAQPDPDVPPVVHYSQTIEDLLFEGISWWRVTAYAWDSFPARARRLEPCTVSVDPPIGRTSSPLPSGIDPRQGVVWVDGVPVPAGQMIRFDSPNPGVLQTGARALRRAVLLDRSAKTYAETPSPGAILSPTPDAEPLTADEQKALIDKYQALVRSRGAVYADAVQINPAPGVSARELQLAELQRQATIEIANLLGLDVEELGVSTTSRTYSNVNDRRIDKINETLSPYMKALTDRLSMPDVTPRTRYVRHDLNGYLRSNPVDRASVQKTYVDMGVITAAEVRKAEGYAGPPPEKPAPAPEPPTPAEDTADTQGATVDASRELATLDFEQSRLTFVPLPLETFNVDMDSRTITGVAVPYGRVGNGYRFERGALQYSDVGKIKLNVNHDRGRTVGVATSIKDGPQGLRMSFRVPDTAEGNDALTLAKEGVLDGLSVEIDPPGSATFEAVPDPRNKTGLLVKKSVLRGVAVTGDPAFDDARIERVVMSKEDTVPDTDTTPQATPEASPALVPAPTTTATPAVVEFGQPQQPATAANTAPAAREFVNPVRPVASLSVQEPAPYRFNRQGSLVAGSHDLARDLWSWQNMHDRAAYDRALNWVRAQFTDDPIAAADVNELNPTINYPRFVDEREFSYPLWSRLGRGDVPNGINSFQWVAYSTSGITIATHSTGTDPESKDITTTGQTVTPTAYSARVQVPRELWDQMGQSAPGSPNLSDLIWRRVTRAWAEKREAVIDAVLDAASPTSLATFTAGGGTSGQTLASELTAGLAKLQYARGGYRFDFVATQVDLFSALIGAKDSSGRPLYPVFGPTNANGQVSGPFGAISVGGVPFVPNIAGDATTTTATSSYLLDSTAVDAWSSAPQRLDITHSVSYIDIGVWGYMAAAVNDLNGVREISYDPVA